MAGHEATQPQTPDRVLVILPANRITLPEILRNIEAGNVVLIILSSTTETQPK
jgi:hypothetical protein